MRYGVDIGQSFNRGWEIFRSNALFLIVCTLIVGVISMVLAAIPVVNLLQIIWGGPLLGGLVYATRDAATGARQDYMRVFDGFRLTFGPMAISYIAIMILSALPLIPPILLAISGSQSWWILAIICVFGSVLIQALFMLTYFYIVEEGKGAQEAMYASKDALSGNMISAFLFILAVSLVLMVGALFFGVGLLIAGPLAVCIVNGAFEQFSTAAGGAQEQVAPPVVKPPGVPAVLAPEYKKGEYVHCFVFYEGITVDEDKAWDIVEETMPSALKEPNDPDVTGKGIPSWPKSKKEFFQIVTDEIENYMRKVPTAPDYLDKNVFKVKMKAGKEKKESKNIVLVSIVAL